jgi:hypothetical protein
MPGDKWGDAAYNRKNPGYFDPAYMPLFAAIDEENAEFWSKTAYDANMKLYESSSDEVSTGLVDDWTDKNGKSEDDYYSYDASRAPWRNAKAVCWHGDQRALAIDKKMAEFVSKVNASDMKGPVIRSSGSLGNDHNSTFVTSLMTALISDSKYQSKLDEYWKEAVALGDENYFNQSLKLLNGLLVSGNMPNLMTAGSNPPPQSSSSAEPPQSSSSSEMNVDLSSSSDGSVAVPEARLPAAVGMSQQGRALHVNAVGHVCVDMFSVTGTAVKTLWNGNVSGSMEMSLKGIPAGIYVLRVQTAGGSHMKKIRLE